MAEESLSDLVKFRLGRDSPTGKLRHWIVLGCPTQAPPAASGRPRVSLNTSGFRATPDGPTRNAQPASQACPARFAQPRSKFRLGRDSLNGNSPHWRVLDGPTQVPRRCPNPPDCYPDTSGFRCTPDAPGVPSQPPSQPTIPGAWGAPGLWHNPIPSVHGIHW